MIQEWRDQFIADATRAGVTVTDARKLLRIAARMQRLAEAQCNGDWPADNGQREVSACPRCQSYWVPSVLKSKGCPGCRATDRAGDILAGYGFEAVTQGDPRGYILVIKTPTKEIGVPSCIRRLKCEMRRARRRIYSGAKP